MSIQHPKPIMFGNLIKDKNRSYRVPLFQRPYAWEKEEVSELWEDISRNAPPYFLGILLFRPLTSEEKRIETEFEIVDGQQRLATLMILIRAAVEVIKEVNSQKADEIERDFLTRRDSLSEVPKLPLVLSKVDQSKFEAILLGEDVSHRGKKKYPSWKKLDNAFKYFRDRFEEIRQQESVEGIIKFLKNQVTTLSFVEVHLETDGDAYLFFEALNDKGMDLSVLDLVKNRICMTARDQKLDIEDSVRRINDIAQVLGNAKTDRFFLHYCWSNSETQKPPPRKELMDWYYEQIKGTKNVVKEFIDELDIAVLYYEEFINPKSCSDIREKELLTNLKALDASRCYPLLLQAKMLLHKNLLRKEDFLKLCRAVEMLTFHHSSVLKWDAKELEQVYYELAKSLRKGEVAVSEAIKTLKGQKAMKFPKFEDNFSTFAPGKDTKVARYALWKFEQHKAGARAANLDWFDLTVEHILPQTPKKAHGWTSKEEYEEYCERLGNLTLLSGQQNSELLNKTFEEKRNLVYKKEEHILLTKELADLKVFDKKVIKERQEKFCKRALEIWDPGNIS